MLEAANAGPEPRLVSGATVVPSARGRPDLPLEPLTPVATADRDNRICANGAGSTLPVFVCRLQTGA
ncbi:MAG TPA: hypothetical protein PK640_12805, partial [Verrucomicrobiota bacterium]|nr:hypothetical protein [Verrucomicrobiota bacterium]